MGLVNSRIDLSGGALLEFLRLGRMNQIFEKALACILKSANFRDSEYDEHYAKG